MSEQIDLDNPADARFFLRGIRIKGRSIKFLTFSDGKNLAIDDMSDEQAIYYAKELWLGWLGGVEGESGHIELASEGQLQ